MLSRYKNQYHVGNHILVSRSHKRGWIRIRGYGIAWKNINTHPKLFSERYGYTKYIMVGRYLIKLLEKPSETIRKMLDRTNDEIIKTALSIDFTGNSK